METDVNLQEIDHDKKLEQTCRFCKQPLDVGQTGQVGWSNKQPDYCESCLYWFCR